MSIKVVAISLLVSVVGVVVFPSTLSTVQPTFCDTSSYANKVYCLTNEHRSSIGLKPLTKDRQNIEVAKARADHLCRTNTFTHNNWTDFLDIEFTRAGENLAEDFNSPNKAFAALLDSPLHKKAIEGDWSRLGVYTAPCGGKNITVQIFTKV